MHTPTDLPVRRTRLRRRAAVAGAVLVVLAGTAAPAAHAATPKPAAPTVTAVTGTATASGANQVAAGGTITVTGTGFTGTTSVGLGRPSVPVTSFRVVSSTQLTAVVSGKTRVDAQPVTVTNSSGSTTSTATVTVVGLPAITSFSPSTAPAGATVTVAGANLQWVNALRVGTTAVSFARVATAAGPQLQFVIPAGLANGALTATTLAGSTTTASALVRTL